MTATNERRRLPRLDGIVDATGSLRAIALLRALMGLVVIRHLWPDLRANVLPVERFHVPWWSWLPLPSPTGYRALAWLGVAAGAAMAAGVATRLATRVAFAVVTYLLFVDMTGFAHNRGFLVWLLFGLCLVRADGAFTLAAGRAAPGATSGLLWPVVMVRVVVSAVYVNSGATKLANPDWRSGLVLWDRVVRHEHLIPFDGWVHDVVTSRALHHVLSPAAIAVELFIGLGLWSRRARIGAIWVAILFHVSIELAASVQTFSYSAIAALLIWVTPAERDRTFAGSPRLSALVGHLDWLGRFRIEREVAPFQPSILVERDGTIRRGRDATLTALSRLPLLFPFAAPFLAAYRLKLSWPRRGAAVAPGIETGAPAPR